MLGMNCSRRRSLVDALDARKCCSRRHVRLGIGDGLIGLLECWKWILGVDHVEADAALCLTLDGEGEGERQMIMRLFQFI